MNSNCKKVYVNSENAKKQKIVINKNQSVMTNDAFKLRIEKRVPTNIVANKSPIKQFIPWNKECSLLSRPAESYKAMLYSLEGAAMHARLPYAEMSSEEKEYFPNLYENQDYLHVRNRILCMWLHNPKDQLTLDHVLSQLDYNCDPKLIRSVHLYLERYGYINYGIFKIEEMRNLTPAKRVIVVGAGIAGVVAARQLQYFGFEVLVLEARDRVGGRMATFRHDPNISDLGPLVLHGVHGNPLSVLAQQDVIELTPFFWKLKMHEANGRPIAQELVKLVDKKFDKLIADIVSIQQQMDDEFENTEDALKANNSTLDDALKTAINKRKIARLLNIQNKMQKITETQQQVLEKYKKTLEIKMNCKNEQPLTKEKLRSMALEYKTLNQSAQQLELKLQELENSLHQKEFLNAQEQLLFDWHLADLEAFYGSNVSDISLKHMCDKIDYRFIGPQSTLRTGMSYLPLLLTQGLQVRKNTRVLNIHYNAKGVQVLCENVNGKIRNTRTSLAAEFVVCTLPIGVLKDAITHNEAHPTDDVVQFVPPLPSWKQAAIDRMGVGLVNRVVLFFDHIFWDTKYNAFGNVNTAHFYRGEFYMFYSVANTPVLTTTISGHLAWKLESADDEELKSRCVFILRQIFGEEQVPEPKETLITRWGSDICSRGSTSYATTETLLSDYDTLAAPLCDQNAAGVDIPRVFFAGEHTSRHYAGTVHGAFLSGLREAGRIATTYFGPDKM